MAESKPKGKAAAPAPVVDAAATHLLVQAKRDGFRRAGRSWPAEQTVVAVDEFTEEQLAELMAEPQLVVVPTAGEPAETK